MQTDPVAVHEFDVEHGMILDLFTQFYNPTYHIHPCPHLSSFIFIYVSNVGMLSRISHPNVIKLMGAGRLPRRFVVLEYLGGGSLNTILSQNATKPGFAQRLFRRPTFTYSNLLSKARDIAEALNFLHQRCHNGATIIHRDLKPDNVGFTSSGILKLFDFGLCTCVRQRRSLNEAYELTGNTGSLRYMAPEVALRQPYTEKVDVYSFGIMVWQMARDRIPFKGERMYFVSVLICCDTSSCSFYLCEYIPFHMYPCSYGFFCFLLCLLSHFL